MDIKKIDDIFADVYYDVVYDGIQYQGEEKEYFTAKRKAARRFGHNVRYAPAGLPSNKEIREQILALPDTRAATVRSGGFAERHDPMDQFKPFLAADLYSKESSWICLGEDGQGFRVGDLPADIHSRKLKWRSAFLQD